MKTITDSRYLVKRFLAEKLRECTQSVFSKRILDVGCGEKPYMTLFPNTNHYVGIDERSASSDVRGVGEYLPFKSKAFDTAICTQVLEHVENPRRVLEELNRSLTDNGVLILSTHGFWIKGHETSDYWRWTLQGLNKIFEESGFNIIESHSMEPYPSFLQFCSLFVPTNFAGSLFQALVNLSGLFMKALGNRGPSLHVVHVIKAMKKSCGNGADSG